MKKSIILLLSSIFILNSFSGSAQTCASNSRISGDWPSHRHFFTGNGNIYNVATNTSQNFAGVTSYEGNSCVSDDQGNLLFFTNGRTVWNAAGTQTYTGLLEGNEGSTGTAGNGSAAQGVITVRHPLNTDFYYVFTTDDVLSPTSYGFNYAILNPDGTAFQGSQRIGAFNTTEAIAATFHANGVDIWITIQEYNSANFRSYLLTCEGLNTNAVISSVGLPTASNQARGGIAFSHDGNNFAAGHPNFFPNGGKELMLFDFNNVTGAITNPRDCSPTGSAENLYDLVFSADDTKIYASNNLGNVYEYDITSGVGATIAASIITAGIPTPLYTANGSFTSIELGPNGDLYTSNDNGLKRYNGALSGSLAAGNFGLSTRFLPPAEEPEITPVTGNICSDAGEIDLSTNWVCLGTNAEGAPGTYTAFNMTTNSVSAGITNATTGIFNPASAGVGNHRIIFTRCSVDDTIFINVVACTSCVPPTNLDVDDATVCEGADNTFSVTFDGVPDDDYYISWYNNASPAVSVKGPLTDGTVNSNQLALTNIPLTQDGTWTVRIEDGNNGDAACYTEQTFDLEVVPMPTASIAITPNDSVCEGETVTLTASATNDLPGTTYAWGDDPTTDPIRSNILQAVGNVDYTVIADNGAASNDDRCADTTTTTIVVIPNPIASIAISPNDSVCQGESVELTPSGGTTLIWEDNSTDNPRTITTTGDYTLTASNFFCTDDSIVNIVIKPIPVVTAQGTPVTICSGDATGTLDVSSDQPLATFTWTSTPTPLADYAGFVPDETTGAADIPDHSPEYTGAGTQGSITYAVRATLNGCISDPENYVVQIDRQPVANAGADQQICSTTANLGANDPAPFTGTWTKIDRGGAAGIGPGSITTSNQFDSDLTGLINGDSTYFEWTVTNGLICSAAHDTVIIKVTDDEVPDVTLVNDTSICSGGLVNLRATGVGTGINETYRFFNGIDEIRASSTDNTYLGSPDFVNNTNAPITLDAIVEMTSNTLCLAAGESRIVRDTVEITIDPAPRIGRTYDTLICSDNVLITQPIPISGTGSWVYVSGPGRIAASDLTSRSANVTGLTNVATEYAWVIRSPNDLCPVDSNVVEINKSGNLTAPNVNDQSDTICETEAYPILTGTALNGAASPAETSSWTSEDGAIITTSGLNATITAGSMTTGNTYRFVYSTSNGLCPNKYDTLSITILAAPTVTLTPIAANTCGLTPYDLEAEAINAASVSWDDGLIAPNKGSFNPTDNDTTSYTPFESVGNTYTLTITATGNGTCPNATASMNLTVNPGPTVNAGADAITCAGTAFDLSSRGAGNIASVTNETSQSWTDSGAGGTFDVVGNENPTYTPPIGTTSGIITLTLTGNGIAPCTSVNDAMDIEIIPIPTAVITPANATICAGETANFTASGGTPTATYDWNNIVGTDDGASQINLSPATTTTYTVTVNNGNNCTNNTSTTVTVVPLPVPSIAAVAPICAGETVSLTASGGIPTATYDWNNIAGTDDGASQTNLSPTITTTYTVIVNNGNNCTNNTSIIVTVKPLPVVNPQGTPPSVCTSDATDPISLSSNPLGASFTWENTLLGPNTSGAAPDEVIGASSIPVHFPLYTGLDARDTITYRVRASLNGCESADSVPYIVIIDQKPVVTAVNGSGYYCTNDSYDIEFILNDGNLNYAPKYFWSKNRTPDPNNPIGSAALLGERDSEATVNTYAMIAINNNCSVRGDAKVEIKQPEVSASATPNIINQGESTEVTATTNGENYSFIWSTDPAGEDGDGNQIDYQFTSTPTDNVIYTITVGLQDVDDPSSSNCIANSSTEVRVINRPIPDQIFTPGNGDGINDYWRIQHLNTEDYPNNEVRVFNRWGNVVYEGIGYDYDGESEPDQSSEKWDGTKNNKLVPVATYYYVIRLNDEADTIISGAITIVR